MSRFITLLILIGLLPVISFAAGHGHGGHGGHGHGGGHSHGGGHGYGGGHAHYHGEHGFGQYGGYHHHSNRSFRNESREVHDYPLHGVQETDGGLGALSPKQLFADENSVKLATPVYFFSYHYYVTDGLAIGIDAAAQTVWGRDTCQCTPQQLYNYKYTALSLAIDVKLMLYSGPKFQVYSGLSAGVTHVLEHDVYDNMPRQDISKYVFTGQATLVGVRYGRVLGVFGEFGVGYRGMFCAGISYEPNFSRSQSR